MSEHGGFLWHDERRHPGLWEECVHGACWRCVERLSWKNPYLGKFHEPKDPRERKKDE